MIYLLDCYSCVVWKVSLAIKSQEEIYFLLALELGGNLGSGDNLFLRFTAVDKC